MPDSFDPELDTTLGEPTLSKLYEHGTNGAEAYLIATLTNGEEYALDVRRWNWAGQPLVVGPASNLLVSPRRAAQELEHQVKTAKPPVSLKRHKQLAAMLITMTAQLDALGLELFRAAGGPGNGLRDLAWDACDHLRDLALCLDDLAIRDHAGDPEFPDDHIYPVVDQPPCGCDYCKVAFG